jgi:hypothetical protein
MKVRTTAATALCAAALVSTFTVPGTTGQAVAVTNRVQNGTFAQPDVRNANLQRVRSLPNWTIGKTNAVDLYGAAYARTPNGTQAVDLNTGSPSMISQTIETTPGQTVTVTWKHSRNTYPDCVRNHPNQPYEVSVSGVDEAGGAYQPSKPAGTWVGNTVTFQATGEQHTLRFESTATGGCGALITEVRATEAAQASTG